MAKTKRKKERQFTPLKHHQKVGSTLKTPLSQLNMQSLQWDRDFLPEHLWIASLADTYGIDNFHDYYNLFMDAVDQHLTGENVALGLISDFGLLPEQSRKAFAEENRDLIKRVFWGTVGPFLSHYPDSPSHWLLEGYAQEVSNHEEWKSSIESMGRIVRELLKTKDRFASRVRIVPLNRLLKHKKVTFAKDLEIVKLLPKYPQGLSEEEMKITEASVRSLMNIALGERNYLQDCTWPKLFWRHNALLVPCRPIEREVIGEQAIDANYANAIEDRLRSNSDRARAYLSNIREQIWPDLYDPTRNEVVLGLFARITRLYCLMMDDHLLWSRDTGSIMLRCLTDTAITFGYLVKKATQEEFNNYVAYGEGQQKLLMLHLQDTYPGDFSLEGMDSTELAESLGVFPEMLNIELGHWTKKDSRRLAQDAGMEKIYRLVYTPSSSDLHGSWMSLKNSNLTICAEPLHRYHRMPTFAEPPFFLNVADVAGRLFNECVELSRTELGFPAPQERPENLEEIILKTKNNKKHMGE